MENEKVDHTKNKSNVIKFIISVIIFIISFSYVSDNLYRIVPLSYFKSDSYRGAISDFLHGFYDLEIQLPKVSVPYEEIEVTKQEIYDYRERNEYESYEYDDETGEETLVIEGRLTDTEIIEKLRDEKYRENQSRLDEYRNYYYPQEGAFYYQLTDRDGNYYSNLPEQSVPTLNTVTVPLNNDDYYYHDSYGLKGKLFLPTAPMGQSTILAQMQEYQLNQLIWLASLIITVLSIFPAISYFKKIKDYDYELPDSLKVLIQRYSNLPIEARAAVFVWSFLAIQNMNFWFNFHWIIRSIIDLVANVVIIVFFIAHFPGIIRRIQNPDIIKQEWAEGFYNSNIEEWRKHPTFRMVFSKVLLYTIIIGAWGISIGLSFVDGGFLIIFGGLSILIAFILLGTIKKRTKQVQRIVDGLHDMARGDQFADIPAKNPGIIGDMARDLNRIKEGVTLSNKKQYQSERLKTELITNVSHDLRTPLTSILNYVDLAKRDDITDEERIEYLEILDQKSKRLKVLIDDLFEASKMASGAVEVEKERVDLVSLMHQSVAEYEDRFEAAHLALRTKVSNAHMYAYVDGRKMHRVFENLLNNTTKYAQPGTRVYLEMTTEDNQIVVSIKNVSKYELGFDIVELTERFKRGDSSRQTEGSGLGLSIVKSILDLHNADFELSQDGDLFKATFKIAKL